MAYNPLEELIGSGEALATLGTGAMSLPVAGGIGLYKGIRKGYGTKAGTDEAQRAMAEALSQMTYRPKTKAGQGQLEFLGKLVDKAKIPPYTPMLGSIPKPGTGSARYVAGRTAEALGPKLESYMGNRGMILNAVKEPGGHFTPASAAELRRLLVKDNQAIPELGPRQHISDWADTAIPRYLGKHAGTAKDPAKALRLGQDLTYEKVMDKSLKGKPMQSWLDAMDTGDHPASQAMVDSMAPPMARPHEMVWHLKPKPELERFMSHVGDMIHNFAPEDLKRMDLPTLLKKVSEMDARKTKSVAKTGDARQLAALELMRQHPDAPVLENELGKWLRFRKGMDPEYVKQGLSVDTCFGDHCVASIGHGKPNLGYPGHVPVRDIVTKQNPLAMEDGGRHVRDTTTYIESVLQGKGDIYSLRTPQGIPVATMETIAGKSDVPRSFVRDKLMTKADYLRWQKTMRQLGAPIEQNAPLLPASRLHADALIDIPQFGQMGREELQGLIGNIGGGKVSPARGTLDSAQIATINEMYPQYADKLKKYMENPPSEVTQYKGHKNYAVSPRYAQMTTDMLRQQQQADMIAQGLGGGKYDLERGGILQHGGSGKLQSADELISQMGRAPNIARLKAELDALKQMQHLDADSSELARRLMREIAYLKNELPPE